MKNLAACLLLALCCPARLLAVEECITVDVSGWGQECLSREAIRGDAARTYYQQTGVDIGPDGVQLVVQTRRLCVPGAAFDVPTTLTQARLRAQCDERVARSTAEATEIAGYQQAISASGCNDTIASNDARLDAAPFATPAQIRAEFKRLWRCVRAARRGL